MCLDKINGLRCFWERDRERRESDIKRKMKKQRKREGTERRSEAGVNMIHHVTVLDWGNV